MPKFIQYTKNIVYFPVLYLGAAPGGVSQFGLELGKLVATVSESWDAQTRKNVKEAKVESCYHGMRGALRKPSQFGFFDSASFRQYHQ